MRPKKSHHAHWFILNQNLSIFLSICLSLCLSVYLSLYLSICLSVYLSTYLPIYLLLIVMYVYVCIHTQSGLCIIYIYTSVCVCVCVGVYIYISQGQVGDLNPPFPKAPRCRDKCLYWISLNYWRSSKSTCLHLVSEALVSDFVVKKSERIPPA